jgi:hypothetical protein
MLQLQVSPSQGAPFEVAVNRDEMVIGRSTSCSTS